MGEQVTVAVDRTGQRADPHHIAIDLDDLRDRTHRPLPHPEPGTLHDERWVCRLIDERPRQARVVLAVQIGELMGLLSDPPSRGTLCPIVPIDDPS